MIKKTNLLLTPTVSKGGERRKVMSQSNNQNQLQVQSQLNSKHYKNQLGGSRKLIPPSVKEGKDFVIKQRNNSFINKKIKSNN